MTLDPQAKTLNDSITAAAPAVMELLSARGKAIFFPKLGILSQSAEAAGKTINATIGIALEEDGGPMALPSIAGRIGLPAQQAFPYAPSPGRPDLRKAWKDMLVKKNPGLAGQSFSLPLVTCALTHGLGMAAYMFCDPGDRVIVPDLYWENYDLIFGQSCGASLDVFPLFDGNGFNVAGLRAKLLAGAPGKRVVCLNFPNNPTGYTPTVPEVGAIAAALREAAERGCRVVTILDDAYFGLVFAPGIATESVFSALCGLHPNLLAVKLDGPTKEDYVWGFRVGFMTYGICGGTAALYDALEAKTAGAIRGSISNASNLAQALLVQAYASDDYAAEKQAKFDLLRRRYEAIKRVLAEHPEYREQFTALPFNSGYFMCVRPLKANPEQVRQMLLKEFSTGIIALGNVVRLAFSATPTDKIPVLFDNLFRACQALAGR